MRVALDTNILAYAVGIDDAARKTVAIHVIGKIPPENVFVPVQALGELFHVLVIKAGFKPADAKGVVLKWCNQYSLIETSNTILLSAMELSLAHGLRIWDAIMLSASASAGCRVFLSEDLHDGFTWSGVTVVNPFAKKPNELLMEALDQ